MTASNTKAPQGVALGFNEDHTPLVLMIRGNSTPMAALREAVVNSLQGDRSRRRKTGSGATKVDIFPGRADRYTVIRDNGPGMTADEMAEYLTKIFSGKKDRVKQANQGAGIKTVGPAHNPDGVVITSWTDRSAAYQVFLYLDEDGDGKAVFKFKPGPDGKPVTRVAIPRNATSQHGTQVELMNLAFAPYEIMKYLNRRFAHFKTPDAPEGVDVRVHRAAGQAGPTEDRVLGYEECLKRIARKTGGTGRVQIGGSKPIGFVWAIRDSSAERADTITRFCSDYFQPPCLGLSFQDEMYEFTPAGRAVTVLTGFGIRAGGRDVVLVIDVDGSEVTPNISRTSLGDNVDRDELKERVRENLPQEVLEYMDAFEEAHFAEHVDSVAEHLTRMYATAIYLQPPSGDVISPVDPESRGGKGGEGDSDRETSKKRRRRRNRSRGYPRTAFVDKEQLGSLHVHYDEVNHVIQINVDHPRMAGLLAKIEEAPKSHSRSWLRSEVLGHVAAQASASFNNLAHDRDEEPSDDDLASALGVCAGAILFLSNPTKYKLGKPKKE